MSRDAIRLIESMVWGGAGGFAGLVVSWFLPYGTPV